tara:strand:+ start:162 stop:548 length:387 start_codon:yes stop_codon:yes gene_type:complete
MAAGTYNFTIEQGATFRRTFKYKDSTGTPIDLALHDPRMQIRNTINSSDFIVSIEETGATKTDGSIVSNSKFVVSTVNTGEFSLVIDADTTASMSFDTAVYDIEIKDNLNEVTRLLQGKVKLSKEVTR